jgi:hypothetical protein
LVRKNKSQLVGIVEKVVLQFPKVYDQAFRESLSPLLRAELEANGGGAGEPAAAGDLWYLFGVAHRNLWLP